ncbi:TolC family protein [Pedobacter sp. ASV28]|uniref:TolC family protein n=1 Tax=Pedobacter sp. ASV28 TaxID=2795123 RepID=UPI0018EE0246|nr:TolC family protein [Pedobacter sp. ASV28]
MMRFSIILFNVLCSGINLFAQTDATQAPDQKKWSLTACIDTALKNNVQINTLRLAKLTSEQEYLLAKASRQPTLTGTFSQNYTHATSISGNSGSLGTYGLNSSVTLYNGNAINNTILQSNLTVQAANLDIVQQENDITLLVTQAYLAVLYDKENIIYNNSLLSTAQAQVKQVQLFYSAGSIAKNTLIQMQAQLATDQYTLVSAKNAERTDLLALRQLLLLDRNINFDVVEPNIDSVVSDITIVPLNQVITNALSNFPDVKINKLELDIAKYTLAIAKAGYRPSLTLGAGVNSGYLSSVTNSFPNQLSNNFNQQIGLTLSVPIFSRRLVKTRVEEAKIGIDLAHLNLKNSNFLLSQKVEQAYLNLQNAQSSYNAALNQYQFSKESYRIAGEQLKAGAFNMVDFLLQKTLFVQAQQLFLQAKYTALLSLKIYNFYNGERIKL